MPESLESRNAETFNHKKVGGWLLLFCLILTVLNPLMTLTILYLLFRAIADLRGSFGLPILASLVVLPLMCFGVYAGVALWRIKPSATTTAKNYLNAVLGYSLLSSAVSFLLFVFSSGQARRTYGDVFGLSLAGTLFAFIYVSIWRAYLNRSRRVGETYGEATGVQNITLNLRG